MSKTKKSFDATYSKEDDSVIVAEVITVAEIAPAAKIINDDHQVKVTSNSQVLQNQEKAEEDDLSLATLSLAALSLSNTQNESSSDDDSVTEDYPVQIIGNANSAHTL